jgi:hypothetical protein
MQVQREALDTLQKLIGGSRDELDDLVRGFMKEGQAILNGAQAAPTGGSNWSPARSGTS